MNSFLKKALIVTLLHVAIVLSLGGKLLYDRMTRPRVWVRAGSYDPDLPIRGRYLTLNLEVNAPWFDEKKDYQSEVQLLIVDGQLVATKTEANTGLTVSRGWRFRNDSEKTILNPQLPFYIPEHAEIGLRRPGEELWAEVTIPKKGPPRPIQLAIKHGKEWKPLDLK